MTHNDELAARYPDLLPTARENRPRDPDLELLIADLDSHFGAPPPPPELEGRIAAALKLRAAEIRPAVSVGRSREQAVTGPEYLQPTGGGREAGRGGAIMAPRRISTIAAAVAAVLVVSLIGILLYSRSGAGTGGAGGAFQQRLLDLGGTQLVLGRSPGSASTRPISADVSTIEHRLADRIDPADTQVMADSASDHLIIYVAGHPAGLESIFTLVGTTGQVNFIDTDSTPLPIGSDVTGMTCTTSCRASQYKILFTGAQLDPSSISAGLDSQTNQPEVPFQFQGAARSAFATYTANNIGNYLTITLDNKVIEAAVINSQITGRALISGGNMTTIADAQNLATLLKSGPLALPLKVISETSFQPGTPAPTMVSCPTPTPTVIPPLGPTATPFATPTATTSTTVAQIREPNVVGEQYSTAILNIENAGLQAVGQPMVDSHVASGFVIKTSPPGGTLVPATQVVTIYYSVVQPTATPPTPSPGTSGAASSTPTPVVEATPTGPEGACATPTPFATPTVIPPATPSASPMPFQTPTGTPGAP
jgi:PASTA domain